MSAKSLAELLKEIESMPVKTQRDYLEERYGKTPEVPSLDERWESVPTFARRNMVLRISQKPAATDTPEERTRKVEQLRNDASYDSGHELPESADDAEVVSSLDLDAYLHRPVLDIDFPAALIPSSTPGHHHLYIDKPMTLKQYENLIWALVDAGIIESGYASASTERGYTSVRLPWVKKPEASK